ncbi:MAG: pilus assembly protein PilM [Solirubrobacteraceae bacterium]|nr:pilus assembly protein PilM [Solirubrobacteraceae bacterium]
MRSRGSNRSIVGLDVDPGSISAAEVHVNGGLTVSRAAVAALQPGIVRDGEVADPASLTAVLRDLWRENKGLGKRVRVGVANQRIVMRWAELPPIEDRKQLDAAVRFAAQDTVPMPLETAVLDWHSAGMVETPAGPRQRVMIVAARRDMVERMLSAVTDAGLRVEGIDLSAFGMMRAIAAGDTAPTLYLSIGGITNLAVAENGTCLFTRVSGSGLEGIAVELAERRGLTLDHSRAWLTHVGLGRPLDQIEGDPEILADARAALEAGVQRISGEVRTSLDFHQAQSESSAIAAVEQVVLTGPATTVDGFADALAAQLALPVEERVVAAGNEGVVLPGGSFTVAAGLAIEEPLS